MKYFFAASIFCAAFFAVMMKAQIHSKNDCYPYNKETEDRLAFEKYLSKYKELNWIDDTSEICRSLRFLEGVMGGEYLSYLELFMTKSPSLRLEFAEFMDLHQKLRTLEAMSLFRKEEFTDILFYSLILGRLSTTEEFKNRCWIYDIALLSEGVVLYPSIFPTLQRFSKEQVEFLRLILEGLQLEGVINAFAYNDDHQLFFKENTQCFDLSTLLFICRMASKYSVSNLN
jgi:hypothetical protein